MTEAGDIAGHFGRGQTLDPILWALEPMGKVWAARPRPTSPPSTNSTPAGEGGVESF
jgi:hypothetical protein